MNEPLDPFDRVEYRVVDGRHLTPLTKYQLFWLLDHTLVPPTWQTGPVVRFEGRFYFDEGSHKLWEERRDRLHITRIPE